MKGTLNAIKWALKRMRLKASELFEVNSYIMFIEFIFISYYIFKNITFLCIHNVEYGGWYYHTTPISIPVRDKK
jgi:hypothetical protein